MTLRRYTPIAPSRGTVIDPIIRINVRARDGGCVGPRAGFAGPCMGALELDHVRASHGIGMKSEGTPENLVTLCGIHHVWKTEHGKTARPMLLDYLEAVLDPHAAHVDPCGPDCHRSGWLHPQDAGYPHEEVT